jgi:hypothetical protein
MYGDAGWLSDCQESHHADLSAPTQAPMRYEEVGNVVEVGDEEDEAEEKVPTSLLHYIIRSAD